MTTKHGVRCRGVSGLAALALCVAASRMLSGQGAAVTKEQAADVASFKQFSARVQEYLTLQRTIESRLPALTSTELPEMITAHEQALARKIREARPRAKMGDIFSPAVCEAFRHASRAALDGPHSANSRAYMQAGAPNPRMRLTVNGIYPDTEPTTSLPPALLAAFPPLPAEVAYRVVGRTVILIDVKSRLVVDVARRVLSRAP